MTHHELEVKHLSVSPLKQPCQPFELKHLKTSSTNCEKDKDVTPVEETQSHTPAWAFTSHSVVNEDNLIANENKLKNFHLTYIADLIENSYDDSELRALSQALIHYFKREWQSSRHYKGSLMILFCIAELIAKVTSKQKVDNLKFDLKTEPVTYKKAVAVLNVTEWKEAMNVKVKTLNKNKT